MTVAPAASFVNRRGGLIFFGIVLVLFGVAAGGMALLMLATAFLPKPAGGAAVSSRMIAGIVPFYLAIAAGFSVLGIGSMIGRRWARALTLAVSWLWLLTGVLSMVGVFVMMPAMFASLPPEQATARPIMLGCMSVFFAIFGIAVPIALILFYRSPNVRATVEWLDPVERWSDRVPPSVMVFGVWMFFGATSLVMCSAFYTAFPLGSIVLTGFQATALMLIMAAVSLYIAIGAFRLQPSAWWAAVAFIVAGVAYLVLILPKTDMASWLSQMNPPPDPRTSAMLRDMYSGSLFYVWMGLIWIAYAAFIAYIRRFFFKPPAPVQPA